MCAYTFSNLMLGMVLNINCGENIGPLSHPSLNRQLSVTDKGVKFVIGFHLTSYPDLTEGLEMCFL